MSDTITAFVLSLDRDSAMISRALRMAGYRVVDPREIEGVDPVAALGDCDIIVLGPGFAKQPGYEDVYDAALKADMTQRLIRDLVPNWWAA